VLERCRRAPLDVDSPIMSRKRPNVVVFFTDQQRWDCATEHGNPLDLMPNFSRMASRGTHLQHSFTCQPVCGPARACWQTGRHATSHGVWNNNEPMRDDLPLLAEQFNEAGYHTGYIGKWHLATGIQGQAVPAGQRGGYQSWLASNILEFSSTAYQTRMWNERDEPVDLPGYRVDAVADAVIRHLHERSRRDEPFMLFSSFIEPHFQNHEDDYPPPDGYRDRYTGRWIPADLPALVACRPRVDQTSIGTDCDLLVLSQALPDWGAGDRRRRPTLCAFDSPWAREHRLTGISENLPYLASLLLRACNDAADLPMTSKGFIRLPLTMIDREDGR